MKFSLLLLAGLIACSDAPIPQDFHHGENLAYSTGPLAPANPVLRASYAPDEWTLAGDSIKYVIFWKEAADSAALGKVDSTFYRLTATKAVVFYPAKPLAASTPLRRSFAAGVFADSFKMAKPAPGDSAVFQITNFVQCRKGDCSVAGSAAWRYRSSYAPPASAPGIRSVEVF